jgi:two-component system, NarL family, nitrate/nitrite response regulator NarL
MTYAKRTWHSSAIHRRSDYSKPMISVIILADIRLYREGLADVLDRLDSIRVVGTAASDRQGVARVRETAPDVALVDMAMPDSALVVRSLAAMRPPVKVLALAVPETESHVMACAEAGIAGYVPRGGSLTDLIEALHGVARGEAFCSPRIVAILLRRIADLSVEDRRPPPSHRLTARELEIVGLIDRGLTNKQIAEWLSIELATVKNHVHNILEKLQMRHRHDAAAWMRSHHRLQSAELDGLDHLV